MRSEINALIVSATVNDDGTVSLGLACRTDGSEPVVVTSLRVNNPPDNPYLMTAAIGCNIRTDKNSVYIGSKLWAKRICLHNIVLVPVTQEVRN